MATEVAVTDGVVRATAVNQVQSLASAVDVSRFDQADLLLTVCGVEGAMGSFVVTLLTGMSTESEDGWFPVVSFANIVTSAPGAGGAANLDKKNVPGLLRYLRWKVTSFAGGTAVSFTVRGMLRNN